MLPIIPQSELLIQPVDWQGLPRTYLNAGELEIIIALIRSTAKQDIVVEIGLAEGRTAKAVLRELPHVQHYIGIDTDPGYRTKLPGQWTERSSSPGYLALDDPRFDRWLLPRGSLDLTPEDFPLVDAVFIDGDHSSEVVRHDSDLARGNRTPRRNHYLRTIIRMVALKSRRYWNRIAITATISITSKGLGWRLSDDRERACLFQWFTKRRPFPPVKACRVPSIARMVRRP